MNNTNEKKRKLNYVIHNPNSVDETAKVLLEVFVRANTRKVEEKIEQLSNSREELDGLVEKKDDKGKR